MISEKSGLDLLMKQKNAEIESLTSSYDELAAQLKSISQERNRYKIKLDDLETDMKRTEFDMSRLRNQSDSYRDEMQKAGVEHFLITSKISRILTEHIEPKYSPYSKLQTQSTCSIRIFIVLEVIGRNAQPYGKGRH